MTKSGANECSGCLAWAFGLTLLTTLGLFFLMRAISLESPASASALGPKRTTPTPSGPLPPPPSATASPEQLQAQRLLDTPLEDLIPALASLPKTKQSVAVLLIAIQQADVDHGGHIHQRLGSLVIDRDLESRLRSLGRRKVNAGRDVHDWWVKNKDRLVYDEWVGAFVVSE